MEIVDNTLYKLCETKSLEYSLKTRDIGSKFYLLSQEYLPRIV